jgi:hypothetical protein
MATKVSESALKTFLRRAVPYETRAAPMDPNLRRALVISLVALFGVSAGLFLLGGAPPVVEGNIILRWLFVPLQILIGFFFDIRPVVFWVNECALVWGLAVVAATKGLREAGPCRNYLAIGPVVIAAADVLAIAIFVALAIFITLIWILITVLIIVVVVSALVLLLAGAFGLGSR